MKSLEVLWGQFLPRLYASGRDARWFCREDVMGSVFSLEWNFGDDGLFTGDWDGEMLEVWYYTTEDAEGYDTKFRLHFNSHKEDASIEIDYSEIWPSKEVTNDT